MRIRAVVSAALLRHSPRNPRPLANLGRVSVLPGWDQTLQSENIKNWFAYIISPSLSLSLSLLTIHSPGPTTVKFDICWESY